MTTTFAVATSTGTVTFDGRMLGETDSHQPDHFQHTTIHARKGERCYACRWSEYALYLVDEKDRRKVGGKYLVTSYGISVVPGESIFRRVNATDSPTEVIELLTTRKHMQKPAITGAAARLLARASDLDEDLQEAWDNRVVL